MPKAAPNPFGRGGAREGAGAKPLFEVPMRRVNVMLDQATIEGARGLTGSSELSAGLREAVRRALAPVPHRESTKKR